MQLMGETELVRVSCYIKYVTGGYWG